MTKKVKKEKSILPSRIEILCDDPKLKLEMEKQILKQLENTIKK